MKARLFALKWARENFSNNKVVYHPFGVSEDENEKIKDWEIFIVLLKGENNLHKMAKVCFSNKHSSNFAIFAKIDESCAAKVIVFVLINVVG